MKKAVSVLLSILLSALTLINVNAKTTNDYTFLNYPEDAITDYDANILNRISTGDDYASNKGYDETGIYISPYWTLNVNGKEVPLYATPVYDRVLDRGVIESYQYIFVSKNTFSLDIKLNCNIAINDVIVLPEKLNTTANLNSDCVSVTVNKTGTYTFLINGDSQEYAVTLFVQNDVDEDAEIAAYRKKYGKNNVTVYEKGLYELDCIENAGKVVYFRRGAVISANHTNDITSNEDAAKYSLPNFWSIYNSDGIIITGLGTLDFTKLDRRERNLICITGCKNITFENLILLNPNSWTVTVYACENCVINNITVFGYRTNSDGINICGCADITVKNSFCRNGDDCFSVKTTDDVFESHDIEITNCIGWSNKARCFGITGEVYSDIYNISFRDCAVIYRNATWDNDKVASLVIAVECGNGNIDNVSFENIEIYHDEGRAFYCIVYGEDVTNCKITNVVLKNITYSAEEKIKLSSERTISKGGEYASAFVRLINKLGFDKIPGMKKFIELLGKSYDYSNSIGITFDNVISNDKAIDKFNTGKYIIIQGNVDFSAYTDSEALRC